MLHIVHIRLTIFCTLYWASCYFLVDAPNSRYFIIAISDVNFKRYSPLFDTRKMYVFIIPRVTFHICHELYWYLIIILSPQIKAFFKGRYVLNNVVYTDRQKLHQFVFMFVYYWYFASTVCPIPIKFHSHF